MNSATGGGGVAGALTTIGLWIFGQVYPDIHIPPEVAAAITTVISAAGAWIGSKIG